MVPGCLKYSEFPEFADTERRRRGSLSWKTRKRDREQIPFFHPFPSGSRLGDEEMVDTL